MARKIDKRRRAASRHGGDSTAPSRHTMLAALHRQPTRWDAMIHMLSAALAKRWRRAAARFISAECRADAQHVQASSLLLARAFDIHVAAPCLHGCPCPQPCLFHLNRQSIDPLADEVAHACFEPLIRKFIEDRSGKLLARPHPDIDLLRNELRQELVTFLGSHCLAGGSAHSCVTDPLGDHGGYFPDHDFDPDPDVPRNPMRSRGVAAIDVYWLGLRIADDDGPSALKNKLLRFVMGDPWLTTELAAHVEKNFDRHGQTLSDDPELIMIQATDEFLYRATRLAGRSPIELLLDRQPHLAAEQRHRLMRWDKEAFFSMFLVEKVRYPWLTAKEVLSERSYRITGDEPDALRSFHTDGAVVTRIVPWMDHWLFSGVQEFLPNVTREMIDALRRTALTTSPFMLPRDDPRIRDGIDMQRRRREAWINLFGGDELRLADGRELQRALDRFEHYWAHEVRQPNGRTPAESHLREHGVELPPLNGQLPDYLLESYDIGAIYDADHGLTLFNNFSKVCEAFESDNPPTHEHVALVRDYLMDDSISYWVFERMRDRHPDRTEHLFRLALLNAQFDLARDFHATLAKYKGQQMRRPPTPDVIVLNPMEADGFRASKRR